MDNGVSLIITGSYFFSFAAICFTVLFIIFILINNADKSPTRDMLVKTAILAFFGCLIEIGAMICNQTEGIPLLIKEIFFMGNLASMFLCAMYFNRYTMAYTTRQKKKMQKYEAVNNVLVVVFLAALLCNLKFHYLLQATDTGVIYKPFGIVMGYIAPAFYLVIGLVAVFTERHYLSKREFYALFATHVCVIAGAVIQGILEDRILVVCFAITMGLFIIYTFLETPDYHKMLEANKRLYEAERQANAANKAKSAFLSSMSHEIRTPMNAVLGMNEMIRMTLADDGLTNKDRINRSLEYSESISKSGESLLQVINDILDISKIESGKLDLVPAGYRFKELIDEVSDIFMIQALNKGLEFNVSVDEKLPGHVEGDKLRVRQVLTNIISNAIKYTKKGKVTIDITGEVDRDTVTYRIIVRDTGIGIRDESLEHLFDSYDRVDDKETHFIEGTGLGLSIVKNLVEMMKGDVSVSSVYGKGSTFSVLIPQKILSEEKISDYVRTDDKDRVVSEKYNIRGRRILVVDDNKANLIVAKNFLNQMHAKVDTALSGPEALSFAGAVAYDLILMDHMMPGMKGDEVLHELRSDEKQYELNANTPVIALTANAVSGEVNKYISEYGFDDYMTKPFKFTDMEALISRYLPDTNDNKEHTGDMEDHSRSSQDETAPDEDEKKAGAAQESIKDSDRDQSVKKAASSDHENDDMVLPGDHIDITRGIETCMGEEFYKEIVEVYLGMEEDNIEDLARYFGSRDWDDYHVLTHGLKSSSMTVGADGFSAFSKRMEDASNNIMKGIDTGDAEEYIVANYSEYIRTYKMVCRKLRTYISE